jgi:DNA (cytosine-5)-methyltransferase 1
MKNLKLKTFIDLFAGIGGFRIGLESLDMKCVYTSEWDKFAQLTYSENFNEVPDGDITKVDEECIPNHDVICAGFPCQAFSVSGKQKGFEDTRGTLFFDVVRIAKYHRPKVLFLENVKNFKKHDNGRTMSVVESVLDEIGYKVFSKVLNSSKFGVPTSRERIYIIGFRKDIGVINFTFPTFQHPPVKLRDIIQNDEETERFVINRNDITWSENKNNQNLFNIYPQKPIRIGTISKGGQGERIYSDLGHTITLSAYGGGVASKTGAYLINGRVRKLSPVECSRVMGFPNSYKIPVPDSQAFKQFGNSVVIPVIKSIMRQILNYCD